MTAARKPHIQLAVAGKRWQVPRGRIILLCFGHRQSGRQGDNRFLAKATEDNGILSATRTAPWV